MQAFKTLAPVKSPVVIAPVLLKHVSGGSPKGGWIVASNSTDSPKGGWQISGSTDSPKGGWL